MKEKDFSHAVTRRLQEFHIRPKHHLGQNFLVDDAVYDRLVGAAQLTPQTCVIEIGTGLGTLTERLAQVARHVVTVENDHSLIKKLPSIFSRFKNVTLVPGNALDIPNNELFCLFPNSATTYKVVANIPYYITGKIIQKFILGERLPSEIILMVQKEVAERISAKPGKMSMLSVVAQSLSDVEILFPVEAKSFFPEPKVRSAVIRLVPKFHAKSGLALETMFKVAKMGFVHRRKKLSKGLSSSLHMIPKNLEQILDTLGIPTGARPQELTLSQWENLTEKLVTNGLVAPHA